MKQEIIIAGFGGQGVLSMGKILAYSGLMENKEVTWMRHTVPNNEEEPPTLQLSSAMNASPLPFSANMTQPSY